MKKIEIEYPCDWIFKVIGQSEASLREAAAASLPSRSHTIKNSNASSKGKYISLKLTVNVKDERDRNKIFSTLQSNPAIKLIM